MDKNTLYWIGGAAVVLAAGGYLFYKYEKSQQSSAQYPSSGASTNTPNNISAIVAPSAQCPSNGNIILTAGDASTNTLNNMSAIAASLAQRQVPAGWTASFYQSVAQSLPPTGCPISVVTFTGAGGIAYTWLVSGNPSTTVQQKAAPPVSNISVVASYTMS